jgi:putative spermidine/putrescine transport system ATP-binding protein
MADASAVRFTGINKSYDGRTLVVRDLDLDVRHGEFLTLLGPSGSGKTTCLLMLAGFEAPTSGEIAIDGKPVTTLPPHRRDIGVVFQNYALFPHLTVADNVAFPLSVRKRPRGEIEQRVARALDMVKLTGLGTRKPNQLSGGQQQRVALARALIFEPNLILLDEPLGALDKQLREEMQYELKRLHRSLGITMIYVTHDQDEAMAMSDRVAVFHAGRIQQLAAPRVLYDAPANAFVAGFVGDNNMAAAVVERTDGNRCAVRLDGHHLEGQRLEGTAVGAPAAGDRAILAVRPERIAIAAPAERCGCQLSCRIDDITYLGDHVRIRVTTDGGAAFLVKLTDREAAAALAGEQTTVIGWDAVDASVYPAEAAAPARGRPE